VEGHTASSPPLVSGASYRSTPPLRAQHP
jgi:hypothetical protein